MSYRAGESIEDFCSVCKTDRMHTVIVVDAGGNPIRVDCGYCHSEHNYRGGPRVGVPGTKVHEPRAAPAADEARRAPSVRTDGAPRACAAGGVRRSLETSTLGPQR